MANFTTTLNPTPFGLDAASTEKINKPGVYVIYFSNNKYYYIGSSSKCSHRINQHLSDFKHKRHNNVFFANVYNKHSKNIKFLFRYTKTRDEALQIEQKLLLSHCKNKFCVNLSNNAFVPKHSKKGREILRKKAIKQHREKKFNMEKVAEYHRSKEGRKMHSYYAKLQRQDPEYTKRLTAILQKKLQKFWDIKLINPKGEEVLIGWNMRKFCRNNNLDRSNLAKVIKGTQKSHKGWRIKNG